MQTSTGQYTFLTTQNRIITLETLRNLILNILNHPNDPKFHIIKTSNELVQIRILQTSK
jgi:hypothetical protein